MKIRIGDKEYSGSNQPIMVILTDQDKENIANMAPDCFRYCEFPAESDLDEIYEWMTSRSCNAKVCHGVNDQKGNDNE